MLGERRLAATIRADDSHKFAAFDLHADITERVPRVAVFIDIGMRHMTDIKH